MQLFFNSAAARKQTDRHMDATKSITTSSAYAGGKKCQKRNFLVDGISGYRTVVTIVYGDSPSDDISWHFYVFASTCQYSPDA